MGRDVAPMKLITVLALFVSGMAFAQEPGSVISVDFEERVAPASIARQAVPLFDGFDPSEPAFPSPKPVFAADVYRIRFWSSDFDDTPVAVEATLFVPVSLLPVAAPVLAFGSGTTGLGDECAPSLEQPQVRRWGYYRANMLSYAGQGVITVFPDYTGFNDPDRPQRYFSKAAEGHLMLDSLRAARAVTTDPAYALRTRTRPSRHNVTAGYSQGGHAALAAADLRDTYAPELTLTGAIGFGSTNSVETLMRQAAYYSPEIIYTYLQMYGSNRVKLEHLLQERWIPTLESDVMSMCVDEFQHFYPYDGETLYTEAFYLALQERRVQKDFPEFAAILDENESGLSGHGVPVLLVEGVQDIIVTPPSQREYVDRLRESGSTVDLLEIDGARHRHTRPAGFLPSMAFIRKVVESADSAADPAARAN